MAHFVTSEKQCVLVEPVEIGSLAGVPALQSKMQALLTPYSPLCLALDAMCTHGATSRGTLHDGLAVSPIGG